MDVLGRAGERSSAQGARGAGAAAATVGGTLPPPAKVDLAGLKPHSLATQQLGAMVSMGTPVNDVCRGCDGYGSGQAREVWNAKGRACAGGVHAQVTCSLCAGSGWETQRGAAAAGAGAGRSVAVQSTPLGAEDADAGRGLTGRGLQSFPFQLNMSSSVHRTSRAMSHLNS